LTHSPANWSFSKVLFPSLCLGYLVLPRELVSGFVRTMQRNSAGTPVFDQRIVAAFMAEGHFARHLKRMRSLYARRREPLTEALYAVFGERVSVDLQPGGMHLILRWAGGSPDSRLAQMAQAAGFAVEALSSRAIMERCGQGLLLGFTNIAGTEALSLCQRLAQAIGKDL
jgi:GntR family transcriptional regulator / MocR family aminotransferase